MFAHNTERLNDWICWLTIMECKWIKLVRKVYRTWVNVYVSGEIWLVLRTLGVLLLQYSRVTRIYSSPGEYFWCGIATCVSKIWKQCSPTDLAKCFWIHGLLRPTYWETKVLGNKGVRVTHSSGMTCGVFLTSFAEYDCWLPRYYVRLTSWGRCP